MLVKTDKVHLIGIGGYGMSALAKLLLEMGYTVSGSDLAPSDITRHLEEMGAEISIGHHARNVQDRDVVIYSTAIPEENDELRAGKEAGKVLHRSELLAEFLNSNTGIAVTGAHGKTTTTTMLALIMERGGLDPTALIGGEVQDFSGTARLGKSNYVVAEADESDQSFSRYRPTYAMITNIEADHLEHYNGSFDQLLDGYGNFVANIKPEGLLIIPKEDKWIGEILPRVRCRKITFGIGSGDYRAEKVVLNALGSRFNLFRGQADLGEVSLNVPGKHNIFNAVAAAAMALELGVNFTALGGALAAFQGAKRRFQILAWQPFMVVDDYAHHPTEIKATLETAKSVGGSRVVAIFQPHRYTRTKYFMDEFADSFAAADIVLLDDIFAASEQPLPGISSEILAQKTAAVHGGLVEHLRGKEAIINWVKMNWRPGDIFLTMGAGDISKVGRELAQICQQDLAGNGLISVE
ncbi:MAG: UDP-N-acetylmuramate--L-alanine ligase [Eubacteriales bacterium]|nr:UDP-N-acetylmuramate--L-alanine ligase [Eubacteriales bacterium]